MTETRAKDDLDINAILGAAAAPLKDHWRALLVQIGLPLLLLYLLVMGPMLVWVFAAVFRLTASKPESLAQIQGTIASVLAAYGALLIASVFITALLNAALFRFYNGEGLKGQFLALRFGREELHQFLITLLVYLIVLVFPALPLAVMIALMAWAAHAHTAALLGIATSLMVLSVLLWPVLAVFLGMRLILAPALTFLQKRLRLFASWRLTRGHFWTLFLIFMVIFAGFGLLAFLVQSPANFLLYMPPSLTSLTVALEQGDLDPAELQAMIHQMLFAPKTLLALLWILGTGAVVYLFQAAFLAGASLHASRTLCSAEKTERKMP